MLDSKVDPGLASTQELLLLPPAQPLRALTHGSTDCGRVRTLNEDHFLIAEHAQALRVYHSSLPRPKTEYSQERSYLFVVADGIGGASAGELASALAVETAADFVLQRLRQPSADRASTPAMLAEAFRRADARIFDEIEAFPERQGMGTTLTLAYTLGRDLFLAHAGDSRCLLLRDGRLRQLTEDHTVVTEMVRQGLIRPQQAPRHKYRHVLTNVLGGPDRGVRVELRQKELQSGDVVLLCSDGLTDMLDVARVSTILAGATSPALACELLVEAANQQGGEDNITVIVARFEDGLRAGIAA